MSFEGHIRGSSLGWKNRKSQLLPGLMHPEQGVKLSGFSFKFIFNTRRTLGIGEGLTSPSCPRTGSHLREVKGKINAVGEVGQKSWYLIKN